MKTRRLPARPYAVDFAAAIIGALACASLGSVPAWSQSDMSPAPGPLSGSPQSCNCGFPPTASASEIEQHVRDVFEYMITRAQNPSAKVKPLPACDADDKADPSLLGDGTVKLVGRPDFVWEQSDNAYAAPPTPAQQAAGIPGTMRFGFQHCADVCDDAGIAATIGHELGHLALKHGQRKALKVAKLTSDCLQSEDCFRPALACVRTSLETQADAAMVVYVNCSQYSVRKAIQGMARIQDYYWVTDTDMNKKLQDHPAPVQRMRDMQETLDKLSPKCDD